MIFALIKFPAEPQGFKKNLGGELNQIEGMYLKKPQTGSNFVSTALAALPLVPQNTPH